MEQQFRLAEIEVSRSTIDEKIVGLFRYDGDARTKPNAGGKRAPVLVIIAEISSALYVYEQLLDTINETAEQIRPLMAAVDGDPMARFEKLVQRLNEAVAAFSEKEPTPIAWNRVNLFIIELSEGNLCLSGIGRLMNLFLQKQEDGSFRSFDLFGSLEQPAEINPKKPFASFICGDIHPGDVLFSGTLNFERLRNELGILDALKSLPPVTAAMEIQSQLESRNIPDDFAAMVMACVTLPAKAAIVPEEDGPKKEKSTESVERMHGEEKTAHAMLSPTIAPRSIAPKPAMPVSERLVAKAKTAWSGLAERLTPQKRSKDPLTMASLRGMNAGVGSFFTAKRKWAVWLIALVLLAAVVGTVWYQRSKKFAEEQTAWNKVFEQALDRKTRAEADTVIGNEDQARQLIKEATGMLVGLDEQTADRKKSKNDLLQQLQAQRDQLRREVRVDDPNVLMTLALGAPENALQQVAVFKGSVYAIDTATPAIARVATAGGETKRVPITAEDAAGATLAATKDTLLILSGGRKMASIDPTQTATKTLSFSAGKASSSKAFVIYNKRPYVLDPVGNMIWKYSPASGGYAQETAYLKQNSTSLDTANAIAIDVNVYVAFADGRLVRYLAGVEEVGWSLNPVDPPVASAASLWTDPDTDRLVIADPAGKRILVFRKDGKLVSQIVSKNFKNPIAVTGDSAGKKLYVVDSNRVLVLDLP